MFLSLCRRYIQDTAADFKVDRLVRFHHKVTAANFDSRSGRWRLAIAGQVAITAGFLFNAAGYYDHAAGYLPRWPGTSAFKGQIVHPQHWTSDLDLARKRIVVIGSGATAISLVPALVSLAGPAGHVTMLQRTPTDVLSQPLTDPVACLLLAIQHYLGRFCPAFLSMLLHWTIRAHFIALTWIFFHVSRCFPTLARSLILMANRAAVADKARHFTPPYNVWDQRVCIDRDAQFLGCVQRKEVTLVTAHITTFTEDGIRLGPPVAAMGRDCAVDNGSTAGSEKLEGAGERAQGGAQLDDMFLPADVVVTATGLRMQYFGAITITVDGKKVEACETVINRNCFVSGLPNAAFLAGYWQGSWTLRLDITMGHVRRVLRRLDTLGATLFVPVFDAASNGGTEETISTCHLSSGYLQRGVDFFPRAGVAGAWQASDSPLHGYLRLWFADGDSNGGIVYR